MIVSRTCTDIRSPDAIAETRRSQSNGSRPLVHHRSTPAYVLLGDPGAGKTTAFKRECDALGEAACFVTARDFLTFSPDDHPEWHGKTLFIDGLDERRAGSPDKRAPFDRIRCRLDKLGRPRFRLSCRTADWLGENDRRHLASVAPRNSDVAVLRLDPLTDSDARAILEAHADIPDPSSFIAIAKERSVDALLKNPQSLRLLADVVARSGTWPDSRLTTFDLACRHLAAEHDQDRRHAARQPVVDCVLDAAGRMCAILLLTGSAGYAPDRDDADDDYLSPDRCASDRDMCLHALSTKLFTAETEGRFTPVHRHLAEFLAARHLERLIANGNGNGLPKRRVLALITGYDGAVVTQHRGLSAWLAALCRNARSDLIERDPIGVVSYGDVRDFTTGEKRMLLAALEREGSRLRSTTWSATAAGALATPDMESALRDALKTPTKEPCFAALVLLALTHGTPLPGLADFLFDLVYQRHRWAQVPNMMLEAFLHNCLDQTTKYAKLNQLLADLRSERVSDWNNELLGTVLAELYPFRLTSAEIWDYLSVTTQRYASGPFHHFWHVHLVEREADVAGLLDSFAARGHELKPALESLHLEGVPLNLLARGVEMYGDTLDTGRLCDWLTVDMFPDLRGASTAAVRRIGSWLEQRPDTLRRVVFELSNRPSDSADVQSRVEEIRYGADFPADYGLWCLREAVAATDPRWIHYFLCESCRALAYHRHDRGLTLELLFELTRESPHLRQELDGVLKCRVYFPSGLRERRRSLEERKQNHENWIAFVHSHVSDLRTAQCDPGILYVIGEAYFGSLAEARGADQKERIRNLFRNEGPLIEAAFSGLHGTLSRDDVPEPAEIISLVESGQEYRIALPFLAGMEEIQPKGVLQLSDKRIRQALAFRYGAPALRSGQQGSGWYRTLLDRCPETVADVLVQCAAATFRAGKYDYSIVHQLLMEDHARVARHATMALLRSFPLRCTAAQLQNLDDLLHAANRYADRRSFVELIAEKLSRPSMTVAQRIHWLAMGVIVRPHRYLDFLNDFVRRRERRISHLAEFLRRAGPAIDELTVPALKYYISLLGSTLGRWITRDSDIMETESSSVAPCIYEMVQRLAVLPDPEASAALDALGSDPALSSWNLDLTTACDRQRVALRNAGYRHSTVDEACNTLHDGPPANPADLAALVMDRLHELAVRIRTGNTDDWHHYWNEDQYGRPCAPKPENSCRKALLSDLRPRLPQEVDAQPEGRYANDRRADIRVACHDFHLPVETKRNSHRELWSAVRDQLIEGYVSDPKTGGYGVYLVFWFRAADTPRSPSGVRPAGPDELRKQLETLLSEHERRRISVCVIDVSAPPRP